MKCTIPEISWHNRDPVLSVDLQPLKNQSLSCPYRLATGGTDSHVVIWYISIKENGLASVEVAADLQRHQRAVNTVRFSPSGQFLASGDDESAIIIWKQKTDQDTPEFPSSDGESSKEQKEQWITLKILRGHLEDVYDLSWSSDSSCLISGSIDNTAILWDVQKGRSTSILSGHGGFVQGVAWDPKNQYVATLCSDRTCRIYNTSSKKVVSKISKAALPVPKDSELNGKVMRLYHDDTLKSFFRRLAFSPEGQLLVTPSGVIEIPNSEKQINATYIFTRGDFSRPVVYLPSPVQYTVAVRFCPLLFKLREGSSLFALPYRMVLAVATKSNVLLYDTQQSDPIALISNIHYTRLTDLCWSSDARVLVASSTDGYCSIITFSPGELGEEYKPSNTSVEVGSEPQESHVGALEKKGGVSNIVIGEPKPTSRNESSKDIHKSDKDSSLVEAKNQKTTKTDGGDGVSALTPSTITPTLTATSAAPSNRPKQGKRITPITLSRRPLLKGSAGSSSGSPKRVDKSEFSANTNETTRKNDAKETGIKNSKEESMQIEEGKGVCDKEVREKQNASKQEKDESDKVPEVITTAISKTQDVDKVASNNKQDQAVKHKEQCPSPQPEEIVQKITEVIEKKPENEKNQSVSCSQSEEPMDVDDVIIMEQTAGKDGEGSTAVSDSKPSEEVVLINVNCPETTNLKVETQSPSRKEELCKIHETTPSKSRPTTKADGVKQSDSSPGGLLTMSPSLPCNVTPIENRTPRRVQLITIASPKSKKKLL